MVKCQHFFKKNFTFFLVFSRVFGTLPRVFVKVREVGFSHFLLFIKIHTKKGLSFPLNPLFTV